MGRLSLRLAAFAAVTAIPLEAHHSEAAEYDASRLLVLTGAVAKLEWTNPRVHASVHLR